MVNTNPLLADEQIDRIVEKQSKLRDLANSGMTKAEFVRSRGISRATLYRDIARRKVGGATGLVDKRKQRKKMGVKIADHFTEIILSYLVDKPQAPLSAIHTELKKKALENNWGEAPSYDKVRRFSQRIAADVLLQWSQGRKARIEQKALTVSRTVPYVNQEWQTDFSELPLWTFDPVFGPELFKPWVTGTIDCCSRIVPAATVCKTVTARDMLKTWKKGMLPKGAVTCPFYGVPDLMSMDNAKLYKGDALQGLVALSVEGFFIENDSPEQNGKQERWFKTLLTRLISHLDGYADQFKGKEKAGQKCIPYPLLQKLIDDFILEYHLTEHSELGMTPWEAWHRGLAEAHGLLVPVDHIDRCLRISTEVTVSPMGVQVENKKFTGAFLEGVTGTVIARVQPEGAKDLLPIYQNGIHLGDASEHMDAELAQQITAGRLERTIAISQLAKSIREKAGKAPDFPTPQAAETPSPDPVILVPDQLVVVPQSFEGLADSLDHIPELKKS